MASLTETAYYTRRTINWAILAFIVYILLRLLWSFLLIAWVVLFPPKVAAPNHAFGKLPKLVFPTSESSPSAQMTYVLQTISGALPEASSSAKVYFMPKQAANLLAISKTQEFARQLTFNPQPFQESRTVYRFDDDQTPLRKLRYDIVSDNFILRYAYEQDTGLFSEGILNDPDKIKDEAVNTMLQYSIYQGDFQRGEKKVTYLKLVGNNLVPVTNVSESNAMRVDLFRGPVSRFKMMTPRINEGQVQILFSPSKDQKKHILEVVYTFWPVDYQTFATYVIKPVGQAWLELQNGNAYVAQYPINGDTTVTVRNIYLAYYDSYDPQTYLQPIYVFEGDHGFMAYVPAITTEWTE